MRTVVNGVMDGLSTGCQWRYLARGLSLAQHREPLLYACGIGTARSIVCSTRFRSNAARRWNEKPAPPPASLIANLRQVQDEGVKSAAILRLRSGGDVHRSAWVLPCKILGPNRSKMFHVKHFATIDPQIPEAAFLLDPSQRIRRARAWKVAAGPMQPASFAKPPRGAPSMRSREAISPATGARDGNIRSKKLSGTALKHAARG